MITKEQEFGRHKVGYPSKINGYIKPLNGDLVYVKGNYRETIKHNLPFALLQSIKKTMIKDGYNSKNLKIIYTTQA